MIKNEVVEYANKIRNEFFTSDSKRDANYKTPKDIFRIDNICYGEDKTWQVLDLYRPKKFKKKFLPVIVNVHGGGWVYGTKETYQFYCMSLAQMGFAVLNFTYRLAPENIFPASLEDTNLVFKWIEKNSKAFFLDTNKIFAVGDSAGAHLLSLYTAFSSNKSFAENFPFKHPENLKIRKIALNCGKYSLDSEYKSENHNQLLLKAFLGENFKEKDLALVNSISHITKDFPPVFIMTCPGDFLKEQAIPLIKVLQNLNIPFKYNFYGNEENPLWHCFHCDIKLPEAKLCNKNETDFFKE